jgi:LacI family transcriptional regulator
MVTIKDVARRASVAPGTVSNVLTGKRPVSVATRQRVLEAVEELRYQPNILARSLVNRRSETIAVVAYGMEYYGPSRTLVGIEQQADEYGYSMLLSLTSKPRDANVRAALASLNARRVEGIIWALPEIGNNRSWITAETLAGLPPMVFLSMAARPGLAVVAVDNRAGAAFAVRHLVEQGRRCVGHIAGPLDWWEARERMAGWRSALEAAGLEHDPSLVAEGNWTAASGEKALRLLLERHPDLDAVFAANDQMALGALQDAHLLGRAVPGNLAVAGFDNQPESAFFWPPLTTVYQGLIEMGCRAVQELHKLVEARHAGEPAEPATLLLQPELIVRESSKYDRPSTT